MKIFHSFLLLLVLFLVCFQQVLAQEIANPVIWKTAYNEFSSSNFYIQIGDQRFLGTNDVRVHTDPGLDKTTLELEWTERGIQMRLYFYFEKIENGMWRLYDLRTYNAKGTDWIFYNIVDTNGNPVKSLVGQRDYYADRAFAAKDGSAKIYCKDCSLTAFISTAPKPSAYGYSVDFRIGIPQNETITISNDPMTGYGVNAVLLDATGNVVKNQSDFTYDWRVDNSSILKISAQTVPYPDGNCAYGILAPCPNFNLQMSGLTPGITRVVLDVIRNSDRLVVATNSFAVKVIDKNSRPIPTVIPIPTSFPNPTILPTPRGIPNPTIAPTPVPTPDTVTAQLKELRGEVGKLTKRVEQQQTDITIMQRIVKSIQTFLRQLFGRPF